MTTGGNQRSTERAPRHATVSSADSTCVVIGGGHHAMVVIDALLASGVTPHGIVDSDASLWSHHVLEVPILGGDDLLKELATGDHGFTIGVGSTGDTRVRRQLFELAVAHGLRPVVVRHPTAIVSTSASIAGGAQLLAGTIVNPGARIAENTVINTGSIIEHDCILERHAFVSPGVRLGGSVTVGEGTHIGIGTTVRQCIRIGPRSIIGAGAVVVDDVPPDVVVLGVPARIQKRLAA
jgi:UDP-perosamine 4-acetyltransferase